MTVTSPPATTLAAPAAPPAPLAYAPARRRPRAWRRAGLLLLLLAVAAAAWRWGPPYWRQAKYVWWQHRCMTYTRPADFVVYEEDAGRVAALGGRPGYGPVLPNAGRLIRPPVTAVPVGHTPPPWAEASAWDATGAAGSSRETVLFLHARQSPAGRRRLVLVTLAFFLRPRGDAAVMTVSAVAAEPANWEPGSAIQIAPGGPAMQPSPRSAPWLYFDYTSTGRFYAGQPDPADPSHFTIAYEQAGRRGTIDGRLDDYDVVTLMIRDGPATGLLR